nr:hypothetical protein [uncultured bacterium]
MEQRRCHIPFHPEVTIGASGCASLKKAQNAPHLGVIIQSRNKVHL